MIIEKDIERKLVHHVTRLGGYCLKWVCPSVSGVPDRLVLLPGGRIIFVELKRPKGGKVAPLQLEWQRRLRALGFEARIIHTEDEINTLMEEIQC